MSSPNKNQQFANLYAKKLKEMADYMDKLAVQELTIHKGTKQ